MKSFKPNQTTTHHTGRKAVAYVRISSSKQGKEGSGPESQKQICRDYARMHGMQIVRVFSDVISGKTTSRPSMNELLDYLRAHKHQNIAVIIPEVSRLARDITSHIHLRTEIMKAGGELMSPSIQFSDDPTAQLSERMFALMSEHERLSINKRARAGERARMLQGYACFPAPTGYKYVPDKTLGRGSVLVQVEPVASIVKEALEKYASGYFETQIDVKRFLEDHPAFPKTSSGKIGKSRVRTMLTNLLYAGYIYYEDRGVPLTRAKHEPLIAYETYAKIQDRLDGKRKQRQRQLINPEYPLRGLVDCSCCGEPLKAGRSKGRSRYYHYYNCQTKGCDAYGKSNKREDVEGGFEELLTQLRPSRELLDMATQMFQVIWDRHVASFRDRQTAARHKLAGIESKIDNLVNRIISTDQPRLISAYESELEKLESQRLIVAEKIDDSGTHMPDFRSTYRTALEVISKPQILWQNQDVRLKRAAVRYAFTSRLSYDRENGYSSAQPSLPFQIFQSLTQQSKLKMEKIMKSEVVVGDTGIEPVTPTMSIFRAL